jgi:hypothetical protein
MARQIGITSGPERTDTEVAIKVLSLRRKLTSLCSAEYVSALLWCVPPVPANGGSQCLNMQISNLRNSAN